MVLRGDILLEMTSKKLERTMKSEQTNPSTTFTSTTIVSQDIPATANTMPMSNMCARWSKL